MKWLKNSLLDIVYVPRCLVCGLPGIERYICKSCFDGVHFLCAEVTAPVHKYYSQLFAIAAYEGPILTIVHKFKYGGAKGIVRVVSDLVTKNLGVLRDVDSVVPVPQHWGRYIMRGYNQSSIIARIVAKGIKRPLLGRALVKRRHTPQQAGKGLEERRDNLKGAFSIPRFMPQDILDKNILLVDDVVTSGVTIDECTRVLLKAGAARVDVLTLAKTL